MLSANNQPVDVSIKEQIESIEEIKEIQINDEQPQLEGTPEHVIEDDSEEKPIDASLVKRNLNDISDIVDVSASPMKPMEDDDGD